MSLSSHVEKRVGLDLLKVEMKGGDDSQAKARQLFSSTFSVALRRVLTASVGTHCHPSDPRGAHNTCRGDKPTVSLRLSLEF